MVGGAGSAAGEGSAGLRLSHAEIEIEIPQPFLVNVGTVLYVPQMHHSLSHLGFLSFGNLLFYLWYFNFILLNVLFWQHYSVGITNWNIIIPVIVLIGAISILIIEKDISLTSLGS